MSLPKPLSHLLNSFEYVAYQVSNQLTIKCTNRVRMKEIAEVNETWEISLTHR